MTSRTILLLSGIFGALGILIGAFGAHSLPQILANLDSETFAQREVWLETGVKYHMYHAIGLLAIGLLSQRENMNFSGTATAWMLGILIFSGCLYAMTLTGIRILGAVVPLGGIAFVVGWVLVAVRAYRL